MPATRKRFTLTELLIVIAVIAILAALLMPSLRQALEMSRRVECANKLKQMYLLSAQYLEDNHYQVPFPAWTWSYKIQTYDSSVSHVGNADRNLFYCPGAAVIPRNKYNSKNGSYCDINSGSSPIHLRRKTNLDGITWVYDSTNNPNDYYRAPDYNSGSTGRNHSGYQNVLYWSGAIRTKVNPN